MDGIYFRQFIDRNIVVFWDKEECKIPNDLNVNLVAKNIKDCLRACGCVGEVVSITAYGDMTDETLTNDFKSAGVTPVNVPEAGDSDKRLKMLRSDLLTFTNENRLCNILLILGDKSREMEFIRSLFKLKGKNFKILLSLPEGAKGVLLAASPCVWYWPKLAAGEAPISDKERYDLMDEKVDYLGYYPVSQYG